MKETPKIYTNPFLSDEENEKVNLWTQELEHSNIEDDKLIDSLASSEFFKKETEVYTDKNVMECELPESLVCYKEGAFHVKDICVDEGIPCEERIVFDENNNETMKHEPLTFSTVEDYYMESNVCSEVNGKIDTGLTVLEPSDDHGTNEEVIDSIVPNGPGVLLQPDEEQINSSVISSSQQDRRPLPSLKSLFESVDQQPSEAAVLNITKTEPATSTGVYNIGNLERVDELSIEPHDVPKLQDAGSDNFLVVNHGGEGESSFSVAGPLSGPVGSTSLRSDSSTTSTRSFAFPILQNEWNSSPVRMAKADRRRLQKHHGWRHGLLCCRF
ncbi:putative protein BREAKING OF ASYMMETRY IN THE STOMATAL LINEAGE [Helianthus annuus]|uniref:18S pre-ribosomal assembly protein gar2-related protein n=1 Tax=Helianthus annuus TaxID=4232 RepID=A0A251T456_HELAN|nr:uncharacterized protein LOC110894540 [Helianthus annuus]XP_021997454.1 uncharacterized protein LOC110894540 [Helianthus annuus]KAF5777460.1 putative protein BREAKING OF ASYMMETRY IN THE STOMATAL LINEAGE [Helianthus annuus]KAJ0488991.1 putative protein BREAKING OF ASYMMETRY IN THE STOMATAL LINEAGE [Helianthus annuus]KAJ0674560.1 putative protein BREAKING OF ASYMMETRY IN THE STOMATAL LINEAGE [Helianthus annuus]KAJ0862269.1 putative protein BREAKING OF ASYMMETRY IN THE STOMATAL LINEAGE [Helian